MAGDQSGQNTARRDADMGPKLFHIIPCSIPRTENTARMYHLLAYTRVSTSNLLLLSPVAESPPLVVTSTKFFEICVVLAPGPSLIEEFVGSL